jgi:hypothetical protein
MRSMFAYGPRPFQVESLVGAATALLGGKALLIGSFGSHNVITPGWLGSIWAVLLPLSVLICTGLAVRFAPRQPGSRAAQTEQILLWSCAVLCLMLLTSKVLSPQFFIWLVPLAAVTPSAPVRRWAVVCAAITQVFYPILYDFLAEDGNRLVALIVVCRNAALTVTTVYAVRAALGVESKPALVAA